MGKYKDEDETVLVINEGDKREGYFRFSTTKASDFQRLTRRINGEDKLLSVVKTTQGSRVTSWTCKVPKKFLSKMWGVRKEPSPNLKGNPGNLVKK